MALTHSITKTVVLQECHVRLKIYSKRLRKESGNTSFKGVPL